MSTSYIRVCEEEGDEPLEIPSEETGTLLLTTLTGQFPGCTGLKYKNPDTGTMRGVRLSEGSLFPPSPCWEDFTFFCVFPKDNKRKCGDGLDNPSAKTKRMDLNRKCTDLIVLGMAWKTDETSLRTYFSKYGDIVMAQVKRNPANQQSKGFGFVRFAEFEAQVMCLSDRHHIDGRWCEVKVPNSKVEGDRQETSRKIFVGRITEELTPEIIEEHFSQYAKVKEVYIPKPFRAFAFVTFVDSEPVADLLRQEHLIRGVQVHVGTAVPKLPPLNNQMMGGGGGGPGYQRGFQQQGMRFNNNNNNQSQNNPPNWQMNGGGYQMQNNNNNRQPPQMFNNNQNTSGSMDMTQNTAALAALNMLNNPNVVAAIMNAAGQAVGSHQK